MPRAPRVSVIVPAYNESARIAQTLREVGAALARSASDYEIIVCAEGDDGTAALVAGLAARDPAVRLLAVTERRGKGHAVRRGVQSARGEIIGFVDADGKTGMEAFDRVVRQLDAGHDLVIGSRAHPDSHVDRPPAGFRRLGRAVFGAFLRMLFDLKDVPDTQCGFKFLRRAVAIDLFARQKVDGYMFDVEILHLARLAGYRVAQVPVRWRDDGDSRFAPFRGSLANLVDLLRIRFTHTYAQPTASPGDRGRAARRERAAGDREAP